MSVKYRYRKQIMISLLLVVVLSISGVSLYKVNCNKKEKVEKEEVLLASKKTTKAKKVSDNKEEVDDYYYKVDIKGEVVNPGLYSVSDESRVSDVIALAGGLTEVGDTSVINLSKKVSDEMVIIIYSREEVRNFKVTKEEEKQVIENCQNGYEGVFNDACIDNSDDSLENIGDSTGNISINTATVEELQSLRGIGLEKAKKIVSYREENGEFKSIEDIKNVAGIGDSIFDKIKENITL